MSPLASVDPAEEQVNTAQNEKTFQQKSWKYYTGVFTWKMTFPWNRISLFRKANPHYNISSVKNKESKMDDVVIQECFDFLKFKYCTIVSAKFLRVTYICQMLIILSNNYSPFCLALFFLMVFSFFLILSNFKVFLALSCKSYNLFNAAYPVSKRGKAGRFRTLF